MLAFAMSRSRRTSCPPSSTPFKIMLGWAKTPSSFRPRRVSKSGAAEPFKGTGERARRAARRDDLRFHDLRHTGAVTAEQSGATIAELMRRLGHTIPAMAIRYQHVAQGRDDEIARRMSEMIKVAP